MNRKNLWLEKEFTIMRWICFGIRNYSELAVEVFPSWCSIACDEFLKKMFAGSSTCSVRYIVEFDIITKADTQKVFTLNLFWVLKFPNCSFSFTRSASHMFESIQIKCLIHLDSVFIHGTFKYENIPVFFLWPLVEFKFNWTRILLNVLFGFIQSGSLCIPLILVTSIKFSQHTAQIDFFYTYSKCINQTKVQFFFSK